MRRGYGTAASLAGNGTTASQNRAQGAPQCYPGRRQGDGRAGDMPGSVKREHQAERLQAIRLRYAINTHFEDQGISTPVAIGAAIGLPAAEAVRLLTRRQWREGDTAALKAIADRLDLDVRLEGLGLPMREGRDP